MMSKCEISGAEINREKPEVFSIFAGAARLEQQLAALQQESAEEQKASCRMVMKLRDQLHQAYQERDEACTKLQQMGGTLETATAAKVMI